jgi:hypothetical protein
MTEYIILNISPNETYNYFFTLVFVPGMVFIPILYILRIFKFG